MPDPAIPTDIRLRPVEPNDEAFLLAVFASTREPERRAIAWEESAWDAFVRTQHAAQRAHYETHFPDAAHSVILCGRERVGRIWVCRSEAEIRLLDIAVLPEHRGRGIGTHLIRTLQEEARQAGVPLHHAVELANTGARRLYERLGFASIETRGIHTLMEWMPS